MDWIPEIIREGILTVLFISGPLVVLAASLGLFVGVLQAATQVQEQTLGSAVKVIGLFLALIISGFYMFSYLKRYAEKNISRAFSLIPTLTNHPMPRALYFDPVQSSKKNLKGQPARLEMKKPAPPPKKEPSKLNAKELAEGPDVIPGAKDTRNRPLPKPSKQVKPPPVPAQKQPLIQPKEVPAKPVTPQTTPAQKPATQTQPKLQAEEIGTPPAANNIVKGPSKEQVLVAPAAEKKEKDFSSLIDKLKQDAAKEIE
ncbi:MAG: flagellar biosynthetic protein FliQ [Candidatus Caenarcaniphilales bacterium]|nr:flagellar biosynthetic protein FliQ [Candidatus Caenarcaniphilales bacterium]